MTSPARSGGGRLAWLFVLLLATGCDHGLAPPDEPPVGVIRGVVTYRGPWPPGDSLRDLRFVAMPFIPRDTSDFLQLNRIVFSPRRLALHVERDTFLVEAVPAGTFLYSGIAQNYGRSLFAWRPVGLYEENDGIFQVRAGDTTHLSISVDFTRLPPFPPQ